MAAFDFNVLERFRENEQHARSTADAPSREGSR